MFFKIKIKGGAKNDFKELCFLCKANLWFDVALIIIIFSLIDNFHSIELNYEDLVFNYKKWNRRKYNEKDNIFSFNSSNSFL